MTDRVRYLTVVLTQDIRFDDVEEIRNAIRQNRYVADVELGAPVSGNDHINRSVVALDIRGKLYEFIQTLK